MRKGSAFWSAHMAAIKREGISTSAYAKRHGIALKSLYYWQRKARQAAAPAKARQSKTFVALRVAETVAVPAPIGCVLILACGMRLEMAALPAPAWLDALHRAAQGAR
ncbi:MAG TPA: hypothetical protein VNX00_09670 [Herbaspirillum sp.]|jgi:transposase-like protein|nr:hypothetical protein [Herbaspirillum sp.]